MKYIYIIYLITIICIPLKIHAQYKKIGVDLSLGVGTAVFFEDGSGVVLGLNSHYSFGKNTSIESMATYSIMHKKENFIFTSKRSSISKNLNLLIGIRQYFNNPENKKRFFINALFGLSKVQKTYSDGNIKNIFDKALSIGLYYEQKPYLIGVGLESPDYLFLRFGFSIL